jgi:hypothetical protein
MVPSKFNVERTAAGQQFVIPGTEKPRPVSRPRYAKDGTQLVIPGAEQIGPKALLTRLLDKPLRPRVGQRSLSGTSLFGTGKPK